MNIEFKRTDAEHPREATDENGFPVRLVGDGRDYPATRKLNGFTSQAVFDDVSRSVLEAILFELREIKGLLASDIEE